LAELLGGPGEGAFVKPPLYVDYGEHISIGARTFINYNLTALDVAAITIGADCQFGPNVQLLTQPTRSIRNLGATGWKRLSRSPSVTTSGSAEV
jgi:maltose O-acetyltransferase